MIMIYDELIENVYKDFRIKYGIKYGGEVVVFIKSGKGGRIEGEFDGQTNAYEELANLINTAFGYTVVVVDNPLEDNRNNPLEEDFNFINTRFLNKFSDYSVIYIGNSSGANYGAWYGWQISNAGKMLLINPIINLNFHRTKECIEKFNGQITFAVGEYDPSFKWCEILPKRPNVKLLELSGQGHKVDRNLFINVVMGFLRR